MVSTPWGFCECRWRDLAASLAAKRCEGQRVRLAPPLGPHEAPLLASIAHNVSATVARNRLKQSRNQIALNFQNLLFDQPPEQEIAMKKTVLIEIGSKEEVALLLALFGTHAKPIRAPKQKSAH